MSTLEKTWLAIVRETSWIMALLETSAAGISVKALQEFEMSSAYDEDFDIAAIKQWMTQYATGHSRIKIALDSPEVMARFVELPHVSAKTLERHFKDNVASYFDFDDEEDSPDNYIINFKIAGYFVWEGHERTRILLAALPKNILTKIYRAAGRLNIDLASINIACECYMRLFEEMIPKDFIDMAFIDLVPEAGHVFLVENGNVVRYASVKVNLKRLFQALRRWDSPERTGASLKKLASQSLGFQSPEKESLSFRIHGHYPETAQVFPEFAVITPKMAEPELADLFILNRNLPFALPITERDLKNERRKAALEERDQADEDQTDSLFADAEQMAALHQVYMCLRGLILDYGESKGLNEDDKMPFARLYVTGIGTNKSKFATLLKSSWQEMLPVQFGFVENWRIDLGLLGSAYEDADWTKQVCLLGLVLKTYDELS